MSSLNITENKFSYLYTLLVGWEVCIVKNCDQGLELSQRIQASQVTVFHYTD